MIILILYLLHDINKVKGQLGEAFGKVGRTFGKAASTLGTAARTARSAARAFCREKVLNLLGNERVLNLINAAQRLKFGRQPAFAGCPVTPAMLARKFSEPSQYIRKMARKVEGGAKKLKNEVKSAAEKAEAAPRMTTKQATEAAKKLGFEPVNEGLSHGEKIFYNKKTKTYISQDVGSRNGMGSHNGGVWKQAKTPKDLLSKKTRMGTYDANLNRIGD